VDGKHLTIKLFGPPIILCRDQPVNELSARKPLAVLAYLAMHDGQTIPREKLAALLWGDQSDETARTNLRQSLSVLRRAIHHDVTQVVKNSGGPALLLADPEHIDLDVRNFETLCKSDQSDAMHRARRMYRSAFLDGFSIDEPGFEEWSLFERRRLEQKYINLLAGVISEAESTNDHAAVLEAAADLLAIEPLDESAHRSIISANINLGRRKAALDQFEYCRSVFAEELDTEPTKETLDLLPEIQRVDRTSSPINQPQAQSSTLPERTTDSRNEPSADWRSKEHTLKPFKHTVQPVVNTESLVVNDELNRQMTNVGQTENKNPKLAVIPFLNTNDNHEDNYFSDGLTEDLITDLSRLSGLTVVSNAASFAYRDSKLDFATIADELDVDYLLHGSVRRDEERIRINAKLIDAQRNTYLWADRFDHSMDNIFVTQDKILMELVDALEVKLTDSENVKFSLTTNVNPDAYDLLLRGLSPLREFSAEGVSDARHYFKQALEVQPDYARARANLALSYGREVVFRLTEHDAELINRGLAEAEYAESLDPTIPQTQFAKGVLYLAAREHDLAVKASRQSIALDKRYADGYAVLAQTAAYSGLLEEALAAIGNAKLLDPKYPFSYLWVEGHILYQLGRYNDALPILEAVIERNPTFTIGLLTLTATYGQLGNLEDADWQIAEVETLLPELSARQEGMKAPYKYAIHRERFVEGLLKAGFPE